MRFCSEPEGLKKKSEKKKKKIESPEEKWRTGKRQGGIGDDARTTWSRARKGGHKNNRFIGKKGVRESAFFRG